MDPFIGTEALASGALTRGQLRWNYRAVLPNVYLPKNQKPTLETNAMAAWLWTRRTGIIAGCAAAGLHGVRRIDDSTPIELIARHNGRQRGVVVREERIDDDEVATRGGFRLTNPARTALDLGRHLPRDLAVGYLDELARVGCVTEADVDPLVERYRGARGIPAARLALWLMDGGAQGVKETRIRLLLRDTGLPRPVTDITITDGRHVGRIGMGWEEIKLGVSLFEPPRPDGNSALHQIMHHELVQRVGWTEILFVGTTQERTVAHRVRDEYWRRRRRRA